MKLQDDQEETLDINITPLIDVVFLLLIFFMVSTTFSHYSELEIELPEASTEQQDRQNDVVEISINAEGEYFIDQHKLINTQMETVKRALSKAAGEGDRPTVIISADRRTPHQAVITAMEAARQAGLTRLTFATAEGGE